VNEQVSHDGAGAGYAAVPGDAGTETSSVARLKTIEAVLFDLDGTLVDTIPHILASFRHATNEIFGAPLPDEVLMEHVGIPLDGQMRFFTTEEDTAQRLLVAYRTFNHATHDEMARLYQNTVAVLEELTAAGLPMGVVTSKSRMMAERAIRLFDLGGYFSAIVAADDTKTHKPNPEPVLWGAHLLNADPARCVYVGDSPADIAAGKSAGAATVGATWGVSDRARIEDATPDAVIDDIGELPELLGVVGGTRRTTG